MLARFLGTDGGAWYNFYSGIFGVLVFGGGMLTTAWATARHNNCHQPRCWRIGRFPVEGTQLKACHRHHPSPPTKETIRERYHLYAGERPGRG